MRQYKKYLRRLRNFDIAIILGLIMSIPLNVLLHMHGGDNFDLEEMLDGTLFNAIADRDVFPEALFDFASACTALSAFRYAGRAVDVMSDEKTFLQPFVADIPGEISELQGKKHRNRATVVGVILAILLSIALGIILFLTGAWSVALMLTLIMGSLVLLSACSGLSSRLGQIVDRITQGQSLNRNYELSIIISAVLSIIPITFLILHAVTTAAAAFTPLGIFTLGCSCLVLMSGMTSGAHYLGLSFDFLSNDRSLFFWLAKDRKKTSFLDRCNNEKLASTIGIIVGIAVGITLLSLGICMPAFLLGLPLALKAPLVILLTMNMCSSLAANIGRIVDRMLTTKTHQPKTLLHVLLHREPQRIDESLLAKEKKQSENERKRVDYKPHRKYATWSESTLLSKSLKHETERGEKDIQLTTNAAYRRNRLWQSKDQQSKQKNPETIFEIPQTTTYAN